MNFADVMRRRDDLYPFPTSLPYVPGSDIAGTVETLGGGIEGPAMGTRVVAVAGQDGSGGYAQFALAQAGTVAPIPDGFPAQAAAAVGVPGATAVLALTAEAALREGETVLVEGAGGGVGAYAVQVAKLLGATVVAAASTPQRREAARSLGADHVIDPTADDYESTVRAATGGRGVDVVLHMSGGELFATSIRLLTPFGRLVVLGRSSGRTPVLDTELVEHLLYRPSLNQSIRVFNLGLWFGVRPAEAGAALGRLMEWIAAGDVRVPVSSVLPLADAAQAHRAVEERRSTGKVVLEPWA